MIVEPFCFFFFFFQAEDGIRAFHVTGVQTCALPISPLAMLAPWGTSLASLHGGSLTKRHHGAAIPLLQPLVNRSHVIALIESASLSSEAAIPGRVDQRCREARLIRPGRLDLPRQREAGARADSGVELVAVEPAALPGADSGAVAPGGVGVGEPLALPPALADE